MQQLRRQPRPSDRYIHDSLFVNAGVLVSVLLMTPAAIAFVGISVKMLWHAAAALARAAADSDHDAHTFLATSEARAFEGLHCVMAPQAAAARAAAYFQLVTLSCLVTSVAQAFGVLSWHGAAASAAVLFEESSCEHITFDSCLIFSGVILLVLWNFTEANN